MNIFSFLKAYTFVYTFIFKHFIIKFNIISIEEESLCDLEGKIFEYKNYVDMIKNIRNTDSIWVSQNPQHKKEKNHNDNRCFGSKISIASDNKNNMT